MGLEARIPRAGQRPAEEDLPLTRGQPFGDDDLSSAPEAVHPLGEHRSPTVGIVVEEFELLA
ncbi:MAG: hypothetical protein DWI01_05795, partial [Planctomycetota bacterium]